MDPNGREILEGNSEILGILSPAEWRRTAVPRDVSHHCGPHFRPPKSATPRNQTDRGQHRFGIDLVSSFLGALRFILDGKLVFMEQIFEAKSPLGHLLVEHRERVLAIAHEHRAANVQVFGSVSRGDDTPDSDIDLLVGFLPPLNLLTRIGLINGLENELGVSVDVSTPEGLKQRCRGAILAESRAL